MTSLAATALVLSWAPGQEAAAFGTVQLLPHSKQNAEHEKITRWGLREVVIGRDTLSEFAGKFGAFGAVGWPDVIDASKSEAHCDNGDSGPPGYPRDPLEARKALLACRDYIFKNIDDAVNDAEGLVDKDGVVNSPFIPISWVGCQWLLPERLKCNILQELGRSFHASQDFYAHSNWADTDQDSHAGTVENPKGLGQDKISDFINPRITVGVPSGLITGCFDKFIEENPATCPGRTKHAYVNKDTGELEIGAYDQEHAGAPRGTLVLGDGSTPRGRIKFMHNGGEIDNFQMAVTLAMQDTQNKWAFFEDRILAKYSEPLPNIYNSATIKTRGELILCVVKTDWPRECTKKTKENKDTSPVRVR